MSKGSFLNTLQGVALAAGLTVSAGALADTPDTDKTKLAKADATTTETVQVDPAVAARGWAMARKMADNARSNAEKIRQNPDANDNRALKLLAKVRTTNPLDGPLNRAILGFMVDKYREKGFFGVHVAAVVDNFRGRSQNRLSY